MDQSRAADHGHPATALRTCAGVAVACVLMAGASALLGGSHGLVLAHGLSSPGRFLLLAATAAVTGLLARREHYVEGAVAAVVGMALVAALAFSGGPLGTIETHGSYPSPNRQLVVQVVTSSRHGHDEHVLRLQQEGGWTARYWTLAVLDGPVESVRWIDDDTVGVGVGGTVHQVEVSPDGPRLVPEALTRS